MSGIASESGPLCRVKNRADPAHRDLSCCTVTILCLTCTQVSPSDCRHTVLTIARAARHEKRNVKMFVFQTHMEELARHLLLVSIFLDEEMTVRGERAPMSSMASLRLRFPALST